MTTVSLERLGVRFGSNVAVRDINLEVASGEMVALLGPSGCGKTTTLRSICGLLRPTSGDVKFDGESVLGIPAEKRGAVLVFQKHLLFPTMTVGQNVGFALRMAKVDKAEINDRVNEMLELVELPGFADRKAHQLSGGQQQRVALARGLVAQPKVLLLDEPLANLDANLRVTMRELIRSVQERLGITAIFVTHDQEEAVMLADRVVLMSEGIIQQEGPPNSFYERPRSVQVATFFRNQNFIEATWNGTAFDTEVGQLAATCDRSLANGDAAVLTARPEVVKVVADQQQPNTVPAKIKSSLYMGTHVQLSVELGERNWTVQAPPTYAGDVGDDIFVHVEPQHLWVFDDTTSLAS